MSQHDFFTSFKNQSETVDKSHYDMNDENFQQMVKQQRPFLHVKVLKLSRNKITYIGMSSFWQQQHKWRCLLELDLEKNKIGPIGCKILSKTALPQLRSLNLNRNRIGDIGLTHLAKANLTSLRQLRVLHNRIIGESLIALNHIYWKRLKLVNLWCNDCGFGEIYRFVALLTATTGPHFRAYINRFGLNNIEKKMKILQMIDQNIMMSF